MGKKKNYWYVVVMTSEGAVFVTSANNKLRIANWDGRKPPLELTEYWAKELAFGLMVNFHTAYPVCTPAPLKYQPYKYDKGKFEWKWDSENGQERPEPSGEQSEDESGQNGGDE